MPQLEFANFASQIFWLAVTFGILYYIMSSIALPTVREVLQNRQTRIDEDLKKAEKLKEEAESAEADFTTALVKAKGKASVIIGDIRQKTASESEKRHTELDKKFKRQAQESEHRIQAIKEETLEEMKPVSVNLSIEIVKKLIGVDVKKERVEEVAASFNK